MTCSGTGLCAALSGALLLLCALAEVAVGLRCVSLGAAVRTHFQLGAAAGAFYSGLLLGAGQALLGAALMCCAEKPGCRNFFLLGVVVFLLGVLTAFSGAVVDGDAAALAERKRSHYCLQPPLEDPACGRLRDYQRSLVVSTVLSTLECLLGLVNLLFIKRYKSAQLSRSRRGRRSGVVLAGERDPQPVSYIDLCAASAAAEAGAEARRGGHPCIELPGYAPSDPELNRCFPFSFRLPGEPPPAYEDIFPAEGCDT